MGLKVIGSGLGRTGTLSTKLALEQLGFAPCHHMVEVFMSPTQVQLWIDAGNGDPDTPHHVEEPAGDRRLDRALCVPGSDQRSPTDDSACVGYRGQERERALLRCQLHRPDHREQWARRVEPMSLLCRTHRPGWLGRTASHTSATSSAPCRRARGA